MITIFYQGRTIFCRFFRGYSVTICQYDCKIDQPFAATTGIALDYRSLVISKSTFFRNLFSEINDFNLLVNEFFCTVMQFTLNQFCKIVIDLFLGRIDIVKFYSTFLFWIFDHLSERLFGMSRVIAYTETYGGSTIFKLLITSKKYRI